MGQQRQIAFVTLVAGLLVGAGLAASFAGVELGGHDSAAAGDQPADGNALDPGIQQFGSEERFKSYVEVGQYRAQVSTGRWTARRTPRPIEAEVSIDDAVVEGDAVDRAMEAPSTPRQSGDGGEIGRIAESNVQVGALDEPDVVKTDGERFYYAPPTPQLSHPRPQPEPIPDSSNPSDGRIERPSHVVSAAEPANPEQIAAIGANGQLLQTGDRLVVFEQRANRIVAFDVSDPANPVQQWEKQLNASLVTAREADGQLYVVTQTRTSVDMPCPIEPLGSEHAVDCADVYAPATQTTADATYSAFSIDAASGAVDDSVSFVGTGADTVVYMSQNGLYITYTTGASRSELMAEYVDDSGLVPDSVEDRILEIQSYNISERSKQNEMELTIERWLDSLPDDERQETREQFSEQFQAYLGAHQDELTRTNVLNVDVDDGELSVGETGSVPGTPLNQFALSEHEGTLRITTTLPRAGDTESINNLYVLDSESLDREDAVTGMGEGQRVYSVRYVDDRAYVVTFRQVDPFYVIDFQDPTDPEKLGELKLPGFSSYMHSVDNDTVLGIGQEGNKVKAALFDVSEPTEPAVADDLLLDEWQSGIDQTHHAFLMDRRHEVFFLPAGNSGYVVEYADDELSVATTVETDSPVSRARYVNDYLYVFAGDEILVLDETDWEQTTTLDLDT